MNLFNFADKTKELKDELPRKMAEIQVSLENILPQPNKEKVERAKSFNVDFRKFKKEDNESIRSTTPQPIPLFPSINSKNKIDLNKKQVRNKDDLIKKGIE